MPKGVRDKRLPIKGRELVKKLRAAGFELETHTGGKHARYKHPEHGWLVTMPRDPEEDFSGYMARRALDYCDRAAAIAGERVTNVTPIKPKLVPNVDELVPQAPVPLGEHVKPEWLGIKAVQRVLAVDPLNPVKTFRDYYYHFPAREVNEVFKFTQADIKRLCTLWNIPPKDPKKAAAQALRNSSKVTSDSKNGPVFSRRIETPPSAAIPSHTGLINLDIDIDYPRLADEVVKRLLPLIPKPAEVDYGKVGEGLVRYLIRQHLDARETQERKNRGRK